MTTRHDVGVHPAGEVVGGAKHLAAVYRGQVSLLGGGPTSTWHPVTSVIHERLLLGRVRGSRLGVWPGSDDSRGEES